MNTKQSKLFRLWLLMAVLLTGMTASAQSKENVLRVDDLEGGIDKTVYVPIYLTNTDSVIAAQFDIELPFAAPSDGTVTISARANRHSVSFTSIGTNTYRVVIMNTVNYPLRGNSGLLVRMPMKTYDDGQTATPYPINITNIVLTDRLGNNIATETTATGNFTVNRADLPDITPTDITAQPTQCGPGDALTISYSVKNIGTGATLSGWTERIYLEALNGNRTFLGSQVYAETLAAGGELSRTFSVTLPSVLHIDGLVKAAVDLVPASNMGELIADQGNNTGYSDSFVTLSKRLYLTQDGNTIYEGQRRGYITATLTRSGDWSLAETFTVDCPASNLLTCNGMTMPCQITIPANVAGATLRIAAVDDKIVRTRETDVTVSSTTGYESVRLHLYREDNDRNPLSLSLSPSTSIEEGGKLTLTATRDGELSDELVLNVACSRSNRFDKSFILRFPVNQPFASTEVTAVDDTQPQLDATVKFTASATDYQTATATIRLLDDDRPALTMTLSQPSITENNDVAEGEDVTTPTAIIRRDRGTDRDATIWLSSSNSEVTFDNYRVVIPAGSDEVEVPIHVKDNSNVDGNRTVTLTAAFFSPSDMDAAPVGDRAYASSQLTVVDDETPYLTLTSRVTKVGEGSYADITVRRYVASTSAPLDVTMSCDDKRVSFKPQPVTIAAGYATATTRISVSRNDIEDDGSDIVITAKASGVSDGQLMLHITDRTLPDAVNPSIACVGQHFYSGLPATVRATIRNYGTSVLPKGMTIHFYLVNYDNLYYYATSTRFFQATTDEDIAVGGEKTFEFEGLLPQMVGRYWVYARLNPDNNIAEFNYSNNLTQHFCPITIEAPFEVDEIAAAPEDLLPGGVVTVTGRMKVVEGSQLNRQTVRVSLAGPGQSTSADTQIDAIGNFSVNVKVDRSAHGWMTVKAVALGQTEPAKTTRVHVYNMYATATSTNWNVDENIPASGTLKLYNTSEKSMTVSSFATTQPLPDGAVIHFDTSALIGTTVNGGSSISIPYTVTGTVPSASRQTFTVTMKSSNGLEAKLPISYFCHATSAHLVFTPRELSTTMLFNADRDNVTVTVKNNGKKTTGKISELITNGWVMSDFGNNRELKPGETATIHLRLLAQPDMHVGRVYKNTLKLTPENGEAAVLPITVTTTGDEFSKFDLLATDVYGLAQDDYSHIAEADVIVVNARTGATVMTGKTDDQGHWTTDRMKEGLYTITVKAARHLTVTRQIAVGPGEDKEMAVLLPYKAFLGDFVVDQDLTTNVYTMKQYFNIDLEAPQAVVVAYVRDEGFGCGSETVQIKLVNVGRRPATNIKVTFPIVGGYTFTQLNALPTVMQPGDVHVLEVACEGPEEGKKRIISAMRMQYEFDIKGKMLGETDDYQMLAGCANIIDKPGPLVAPTPEWPEDPDKPDDDDPWDPYNPEDPYDPTPGNGGGNSTADDGPIGGTALPTYKSFMAIEFQDELVNLHCGAPVHATLRIKNGQDGKMSSLRFIPQVSNEDFEDCTGLFTFTEGTATGFTADGDYLTLDGNSEGTMEITFVPLNEAAPNGIANYYVSGQVSYIDEATGIHNSAMLPSFEMSVEPTGRIMLTYLIQRHFMADDDDTEAVEDPQPAVFSLLVRNVGGAPVEHLVVNANQPVVVSNATSRQLPYTSHYAALDGQAGNYTFTEFSLEHIEGGDMAAANWIYSSEKSGHVASMEAIAGNTDDNANISASTHELFRAVASGAMASAAADEDASELELMVQALTQADTYIVNDVDDEEGLPDGVVTADGEEAVLTLVSGESAIASDGTAGNYTLTVKSTANGWIYGRLHDPTNGLMRLNTITRVSDGRQIPLANFWQTDRTPQADYSMIQEHILHFADSIEGTEESYRLGFVMRPNDPVNLLDIRLFTADGTEVEKGGTTDKPVKKIEFSFSAPLKRFVFNDIALKAHEKVISTSKAKSASSEDKSSWSIDISQLEEIPGDHVLNFKAEKSKTATGDKLVGQAEVTWRENLEGSALITISVAPDAAYGTTTPQTGELPYGKQVLEAIPAEGYQFDGWKDSETGLSLSTDAEWELDVWKPQKVTAKFSIKQIDVDIKSEYAGGSITGSASGIYDYGSSVQFVAMPTENHRLLGWEVNGVLTETSELTLEIVVKDDTKVKAVFVRDASMKIDVEKGWNWVSSYLNQPQPITQLSESVFRIVSQTDEVINDPVYGFVGTIAELLPGISYKVDATSQFSWSTDGYLYEVKDEPIEVMAGWNWISYPYLEEKPLARALAKAEDGDYIIGQKGFAEFTEGAWDGSLEMLVPGDGYLYKSLSEKVLAYNFDESTVYNPDNWQARSAQDAPTNDVLRSTLVAPIMHAYPNTMCVTATVYSDLDGENCRIYAYAGHELRGVSRYVNGRHFLTVYGDQPAEITFVIEDIVTGDTYKAEETVTFCNDVVGSRKSPYELHVGLVTGIKCIYDLSIDDLRFDTIYDMQGRKIENGKSANRKLSKGAYIVNGKKRIVK